MFSKNTLAMFMVVFAFLGASSAFAAENTQPSVIQTCFSPAESCDVKLIAFINKAQKSLDVAIYSLTHPGITQAFINAHNRGVVVRMVIDKLQSKGKSSLTNQVAAAGIEVKYGRFRGIMHNKFTVVDLLAVESGSYNYTANATTANAENQIYLNDPAVVKQYQDHFEQIWGDGIPLQ